MLDRCSEGEAVGAGDGDPPVVDAPNPRDRRAVVEADDELRAHVHLAPQAFDDAHDVRRLAAGRHEVDQADRAGIGLPVRLEDERAWPVAATCLPRIAAGRDDPPAVIGRSE